MGASDARGVLSAFPNLDRNRKLAIQPTPFLDLTYTASFGREDCVHFTAHCDFSLRLVVRLQLTLLAEAGCYDSLQSCSATYLLARGVSDLFWLAERVVPAVFRKTPQESGLVYVS